MSVFSDRFIEVAFERHPFADLLDPLKPGDHLPASAMLAALDGEGEDIFLEAFDQIDAMGVALDISCLPKAAGDGEAAVRLRREEQLARSGDLLGSLEETDPLRMYLEEIAAIPVCGDIDLLAQELAEANRQEREAPELRSKLLNLSLSRVVEIAREYTGYGVLLLDLIQEGSMGLWQNLENYIGPDRFEEVRDWYIRQAMAKAVILQANASGVGSRMRQAMEDYRSVDEKLLMELGRNPTVEEIAEAMHMGVQETAVVADMLAKARSLNKAKAETEPKEEEADEEQSVENTAYFQMRQRIQELLSVLDEREAQVLTLRFGLEGGLPLSPEETGRKLGLTAEEVVKMEAAALGKLRNE